jgi:hypothetical protein
MTQAFTKIMRPGTRQLDESPVSASVFVRAKYDGERLSLTGVEGPLRNGDALGGCGQIEMHLSPESIANYAGGWTPELFGRLLSIWRDWHLNDMRPACIHQESKGYREKAKEPLIKYRWTLDSAGFAAQREAEQRALAAAKAGESYRASLADQAALAMPLNLETYGSEGKAVNAPQGYRPDSFRASERKTLGWIRQDEHDSGLLGRECDECGWRYGSGWQTRGVPESVLAELLAMPDTDRKPNWI